MSDQYCVIQEQGDYSLLPKLTRSESEQVMRQQQQMRRRPVNEQASSGDQVRLGDCSHLDR